MSSRFPSPDATIIAAEWLSARSRELLADIGFGYVDLTGNVSAAVTRPGIVFRTKEPNTTLPQSRCPASTSTAPGRGLCCGRSPKYGRATA